MRGDREREETGRKHKEERDEETERGTQFLIILPAYEKEWKIESQRRVSEVTCIAK